MKTLNLVYSDASEVKYKISRFPDGQQQIQLEEPFYFWIPGESILIKTRLNSFSDLELLICASASLRSLGVKSLCLYVPYFLGSRSDRQFGVGGNNYLKSVICPIINSIGFDYVSVLDPHSDVLEACLNNFERAPIKDFYDWCHQQIDAADFDIISPDAGALKRTYGAASQWRHNEDIIVCSKYRDTEGKLSKTHVPLVGLNHMDKTLVIVDDICDGGRTFINIAKRIADYRYSNPIVLVITHGIFSAGLKDLSDYFKAIYCTNSYRDISSNNEFGMHNERYLGVIKQYDVF